MNNQYFKKKSQLISGGPLTTLTILLRSNWRIVLILTPTKQDFFVFCKPVNVLAYVSWFLVFEHEIIENHMNQQHIQNIKLLLSYNNHNLWFIQKYVGLLVIIHIFIWVVSYNYCNLTKPKI